MPDKYTSPSVPTATIEVTVEGEAFVATATQAGADGASVEIARVTARKASAAFAGAAAAVADAVTRREAKAESKHVLTTALSQMVNRNREAAE